MKFLVILLVAAILSACATVHSTGREATKPSDLAQINVQLGLAYMREGKNDIALAKLEKALELEPDSVDAHATLGLLYQRLGQDQLADRHFAKAVQLDPEDSSALNNYGQFLCRQDRASEAVALFERALANPLYRTPEAAHVNLGLCAKRNGDLETAEEHFRDALQLDPRLGTALLEMADISFQLERYLAARGYLQRLQEVSQPGARSLWLGVRVERALGDRDAEASYALTLRRQFPDSEQTRLLEKSNVQ